MAYAGTASSFTSGAMSAAASSAARRGRKLAISSREPLRSTAISTPWSRMVGQLLVELRGERRAAVDADALDAGRDHRHLGEQLAAHRRADAVGTDQQVAARGRAVGERDGDAVGVLDVGDHGVAGVQGRHRGRPESSWRRVRRCTPVWLRGPGFGGPMCGREVSSSSWSFSTIDSGRS